VRTLASVSVGDELPELARVVTREDVKAYADAGGDQNPLHQDDVFAHSLGFPGIIAHGMFTMGHMAAAVVAWAGEPGAVVALSAQFRAPVFMGEHRSPARGRGARDLGHARTGWADGMAGEEG